MKLLYIFSVFILFFANTSSASDGQQPPEVLSYGSFLHFSEVPNALFFADEITINDSFEFRKAIRNHKIDTIVLSSPGGSIWEGLTIAGIIFDKKLTTFVPAKGSCTSACAFMFFAGKERKSQGQLGVHQFYSSNGEKSDNISKTQKYAQFTTSEIIGFLNEFGTPPFVFEKMFAQQNMYYFSEEELKELDSAPLSLETQVNFKKINNFVKHINEIAAATPPETQEKKQANTTTKNTIKSTHEVRKKIQNELNRIGCTLGKVDGIIGPASRRALNRFNKANKTEYKAGTFFVDPEMYNYLKGLEKGFCQQEPPKAANKTRKKQASIKEVETTENNISAWSGTSYCTVTFGRKNESIKLVKMSETEYVMHFAQKSIKLSKDGNGKYIGYGDGAVRSKFSFEINENKGYMIGRSRLNAMGTLLALSVAASGVCKYEFFRK